MKKKPPSHRCWIGTALALAGNCTPGFAQDLEPAASRIDALRDEVSAQQQRLEALKRQLQEQETRLRELRQSVDVQKLDAMRGGANDAPAPPAEAPPVAATQSKGASVRVADVAPIFEQPGILTPRGGFVFEPSLQYSYSSSNRIALVGYTVIPAILIGVVDVREVKRDTLTGTLTARYGVNSRFELEARLPYVYRHDTSIGRQLLDGTASDTVFSASGHDIGDLEFSARYQFNDGGADRPYFVGGLRLKTRTGKDPFEVVTTRSVAGLTDGLQTELPTGSGFYALQPSLTMLIPSDPAVFFGSASFLHNFARHDIVRRTDGDPPQEAVGSVAPGNIIGFNFGMGLALNERSSFSIGYDHASVAKTMINGQPAPDSVRVELGTLLLGFSYRLGSKQTLNLSLGAGVTRDTPDVTLTLRLPTSF